MPAAALTLITYAQPLGPRCQAALAELALPHLDTLLERLTPGVRQSGAEDSLCPLHERLEAQALGLPQQDGLLPWAALQAHALQLTQATPDAAWAWLTPCHWQVNADHVRMADPSDCQISSQESGQVMQAMLPFFEEDGITLHGLQQGHWLARGAVFRDLPTASLARASGGAVDAWLPRQAQAQPLRRLQNEMQMLLYNHPVNDARSAQGLLPISCFWVSATGSLPDGYQPPPAGSSAVLHTLRDSNLADDASAWLQAWQSLDAHHFAPLLERARQGQALELLLCGEQAAQRFSLQPQGLWSRARRLLPGTKRGSLAKLLQNL